MRVYMTRREAEMIIEALEDKMPTCNIGDRDDYEAIMDRFKEVCVLQCKRDNSSFFQ